MKLTPSKDGKPRFTLKIETRLEPERIQWAMKAMGIGEREAIRLIKELLECEISGFLSWNHMAVDRETGRLTFLSIEQKEVELEDGDLRESSTYKAIESEVVEGDT